MFQHRSITAACAVVFCLLATQATAAEFPLSISFRDGFRDDFGRIAVDEDGGGGLRFHISIDDRAFDTHSDLARIHFDLERQVSGLRIVTHDDVSLDYALIESRAGQRRVYQHAVAFDRRNRNGLLKDVNFTLVANEALRVADLAQTTLAKEVVFRLEVVVNQSTGFERIGAMPASEDSAGPAAPRAATESSHSPAESPGGVESVESVETVSNWGVAADDYREIDMVAATTWKWNDVTPDDILDMAKDYPDVPIFFGSWKAKPAGYPKNLEIGSFIDRVQERARARGTEILPVVSFRNDMLAPYRDSSQECVECGWEGRMSEPFDTDWVIRVPRRVHEDVLDEFWNGSAAVDPFMNDDKVHWNGGIDRNWLIGLATSKDVPALYGRKNRWGAFRVRGALMDLANPEYRAWSFKRLIAVLEDHGIDPGETAVIQYAYKPGWNAYYEGGDSGHKCWTPDAPMSGGIARANAFCGGFFHPTTYGPGEFEAAISQSLREMRAALDAAGYPDVLVMTTERPRHRSKWTVLEPDLRWSPWLIGERRKILMPYGTRAQSPQRH